MIIQQFSKSLFIYRDDIQRKTETSIKFGWLRFNRYKVLSSNQIYYDHAIKLCFHRWSEIDPDWNAEAFKENGFKNGDNY